MNKKRYTKFRPRIRTKNPSAKDLRHSQGGIGLFSNPTIIRFGSTTPTDKVFTRLPADQRARIVEINTVKSIEVSRSKLLMKEAFKTESVYQAEWWTNIEDAIAANLEGSELRNSIVAKKIYGQKAKGMTLLTTVEEARAFGNKKGYYFERFYNFAREYRLHVARGQVFLEWRKLRREDEETRWYFNNDNCNWVSKEHELFDLPKCWSKMEEHAIKAMKAVGLDIGAVDIRVQSNKKKDPAFIVCEVNSAPALGEKTLDIYRRQLKKMLS